VGWSTDDQQQGEYAIIIIISPLQSSAGHRPLQFLAIALEYASFFVIITRDGFFLGENIADNGGLKASFHAYVDYSKTAKMNFTLPGLNYNHRQLFFISFAQV
jgi:hypothetical protein